MLKCKCRCTVPDTERRKTTNPHAAAVKLIAAPLISLSVKTCREMCKKHYTVCKLFKSAALLKWSSEDTHPLWFPQLNKSDGFLPLY